MTIQYAVKQSFKDVSQMKSEAGAQSMNHGMSTVMMHKAFGKHAEESLRAVRDEAIRLEMLLSRFIPGSEISIINDSAGIKSEKLSADTYELLTQAIEFSRCSEGLFDITIGPLIDLWKGCKGTLEPPEDWMIRRALSLVDYTCLLLDPCKKAAGLKNTGQSIDLGGIGKGYAGDKFLEIFKKYGIASAYTNIGGNVAVLGTKPDGSPWRVGIQNPRQKDSLIGLVSVVDKAVVTSGDYQRYFIGSNGNRYHHILDPSTGYPAESCLISATVVSHSSMAADALSTILFIAGKRKGLEILRQFPGAEAILVDTDLRVYITGGLKECFLAGKGIDMEILN